MKNFLSLLFTLSLVFITTQSCNVSKGLAGLSPAQALTGVQALLGNATGSALSGFAGNILGNSVMQNALPSGLSNITGLLSKTKQGTDALGLLNNAITSAVPNVASDVLGNAVKGIAANDALSILKGGDTGATSFLKNAASQKLTTALLPAITKNLTANGGLNAITSALGSQATSFLGKGKPSIANLATTGAVSGLFDMMGNAEKAERENPTDPVLKDIFGK